MMSEKHGLKNITITFDIDDTIATGFYEDDISEIEKQYPWVPVFKRQGLYLHAIKPHIVHPGVPELIQFLDSIPNVRISFFSSGIKERNEMLVKELLCLSLGQKRYEIIQDKVIICSRHDLEMADDTQKRAQRDYYGFCSGNNTKNLSKILKENETLDWAILVEDDTSYAHHGQEQNLLKISSSGDLNFSLFHQYPNNAGEFFRVNHIFYLCGFICSALEAVKQESGKTLTEFLFQTQYQESTEKGADSKMIFYYSIYNNLHYYNLGLNKLKEINPELSFWGS